MKLDFKKTSLEESQTALMVVGFIEENVTSPPAPLRRAVENLANLGDFKGEKGTSSLIYTENNETPRVLLVGIGKESEIDLETIRRVAGSASRVVRDIGVKKAGIYLPSFITSSLKQHDVAEALVQAFIMGSYNETYYKTKELEKIKRIEEITLFDPNHDKTLAQRANTGKVIAEVIEHHTEALAMMIRSLAKESEKSAKRGNSGKLFGQALGILILIATFIGESKQVSLEFIREDELVEVTPQSVRLRKKVLEANK